MCGSDDTCLEECSIVAGKALTAQQTPTVDHAVVVVGYGTDEHDEAITVRYLATGDDLSLEMVGFDIDTNHDVELFLNGASLGFLSPSAAGTENAGDQLASSLADR